VKKSTVNLPDTNAIIRYLIKDDLNQYAIAETFFKQVLTGEKKAIILEGVLVECIYILTKIYKVPKEEAAVKLADLLLYKGIQNRDREELRAALNLFAEKNLDIVDCILCTTAWKNAAILFTFDESLKKMWAR
jgi:predicted nucleic-acid-binding protein